MSNQTITLNAASSTSDTVTADHFGANYVYDYEAFGDKPWERFDELVEQLGTTGLRYPGGNAAETGFDIVNPNSGVDLDGRTVTTMDDFIAFSAEQNLAPTIIVPTAPFLPGHSHPMLTWSDAKPGGAGWVLDPAGLAAADATIRDFVRAALDEAGAQGISIHAFEIGNEFPGVDWTDGQGQPTKMNGEQYGVMANQMAKIIQSEIYAYNAESNGLDMDPQIVGQIWADFNQGGKDLDFLNAVNANVLEEFDADGLASLDTLVSHIYYKEDKTNQAGEFHSYETIGQRIAEMHDMTESWNAAAGRELNYMISEWNVQLDSVYDPGQAHWQGNSHWNVTQQWIDGSNFGMKQVAPTLEMFSAFMTEGVDSAHIWSVMYNSAALGIQDNGGQLTAAGSLFDLMSSNLVGTQYKELNAQTATSDVHLFEGDGISHLFVSSLSSNNQTISLDMSALSPDVTSIQVTYMRTDYANSDGQYTTMGRTYVLPDTSYAYLEADLAVVWESGIAVYSGDVLEISLGAYELAYITFEMEGYNMINGDAGNQQLDGTDRDDMIMGGDGEDYIRGEDGDDWLKGGEMDDAIYGGTGEDILEGEDGDDYLQGGFGYFTDEIHGGRGNDQAYGGGGDDLLYGNHGLDILGGEAGNDKLYGGKGSDQIDGGSGPDKLVGGRGNDILTGDTGDDILKGNRGNDTLTGGTGRDTFTFKMADNEGKDTITDWDDGVDMIRLVGGSMGQISINEYGDDAKVDWANGSVWLLDTDSSDLTSADFIFV
jgi:Ca2+-binding RTX toxin-like protein